MHFDLTTFGFYYAVDAAFYLTYRVLSGQTPMAHLMLTASMLNLVYRRAPWADAAGVG